MEDGSPARSQSKLFLGAFIIALGVLFTLSNLGWIYVGSVWRLWPLILIGIGVSHARGRTIDQALGAWVLVFVGALFLLRNFHVLPVSVFRLWPIVLVVIGIRIVLAAQGRTRAGVSPGGDPTSRLDDIAFFGGVERHLTTQEFTGGSASAVCGAFDIDLRGASMAGDRATIDVFAWWGGGEIKVPTDWDVTAKVLPILGGVGDKTAHPAPEEGKPVKRLVVTGTVVMGGLDIKN